MIYKKLKSMKDSKFKRLVGITREILYDALKEKHKHG